MNKQPEALRLADALERGTYLLYIERDNTAAELRRLHEINAKLLEALDVLVDEANSFMAGGHYFNDEHWGHKGLALAYEAFRKAGERT